MQLEEADGEFVGVGRLSAELLEFLGVSPMLGRGFDAAETVSGADAVALVSHRFWATRLASNPAVLGTTVTLDQRPHVIVGVMPPTFRFPRPDPQVWVPLTGGRNFVYAVARVRPGLSIAEAQDQLDSIAERLQRDQPRARGWSARLDGLDAGRFAFSIRFGVVGAARRGRPCLADRVREHRQPAVGAHDGAAAGTRGAIIARRIACSTVSARAD